jgi:hypothetical protein
VLPGSALGVSADRIPFHSAWDVGGSGRGADLRCLDARQPEPFAYIVAHGLRLVGGACGGFVVQRRRSPFPPQPVHD